MNDRRPDASSPLLTAALGGLLCFGAACSSTSAPSTTVDSGGVAESGGAAESGAATNGDTPVPATECDGGVAPTPQVTSSTVGALTQAQFQAQCDAKNGIFEVQPHCGGSNSCRGFSYDSETQTLTEHSCRATNSCGGFSCVVCD